jgi:hypothetical protein
MPQLKFSFFGIPDKVKKFLNHLKERSGKEKLYIGIPAEKTQRRERGLNNAAIAYIQEFGAPNAGIPPRPFLIPGVNDNKDKAQKAIEAFLKRRETIENAYSAAGMILVAGVKRRITQGIPPPLAESTLKARKRIGFKGTKPLIHTGQLVNSITYVIRKEK